MTQVNVYQKAEPPSAAINCAVAVKSGKDVFIVDRCYRGTGATENYHTKYPMRVGVIGCDKKGMTVTRSGNTYTVRDMHARTRKHAHKRTHTHATATATRSGTCTHAHAHTFTNARTQTQGQQLHGQ